MKKRICLKSSLIILALLYFQTGLANASPTYFRRNVTWGSDNRSYLISIPAKGRVAPFPILITLHGGGGTGSHMVAKTKYRNLSRSDDVIAIFPDGLNNRWNDGRIRNNISANTDDVGFLLSIIDHAVGSLGGDANKVFVVGHSNGAMMTLRLSCEAGSRLAGIGVIAGSFPTLVAPTCNPNKPLSAMFINGTADPSILYQGGCVGGSAKTDQNGNCLIGSTVPVEQTVNFFRQINHCPGSPQTWSLKDKVAKDNSHIDALFDAACNVNTQVKLYKVVGGGHGVPGSRGGTTDDLPSGTTNLDTNGFKEVWGFLRGLYKMPSPKISAKCVRATNSVTISWKSIIGATAYAYRLDRSSPSWSGACTADDTCGVAGPIATSVSLPIVRGQQNQAWLHALAGATSSPASRIKTFTCR